MAWEVKQMKSSKTLFKEDVIWNWFLQLCCAVKHIHGASPVALSRVFPPGKQADIPSMTHSSQIRLHQKNFFYTTFVLLENKLSILHCLTHHKSFPFADFPSLFRPQDSAPRHQNRKHFSSHPRP